MQKNDLMMIDNSIIRILDVKDDSVLFVSCIRQSMPKWETKANLTQYKKCSDQDLFDLTDQAVPDYESITAEPGVNGA